MTRPAAPSTRLNMRITLEARRTLKRAARAHGQDVTAFVLGAALDRARAVLADDRELRLTARETAQVDADLDQAPETCPGLADLVRWGEARRAEPEVLAPGEQNRADRSPTGASRGVQRDTGRRRVPEPGRTDGAES